MSEQKRPKPTDPQAINGKIENSNVKAKGKRPRKQKVGKSDTKKAKPPQQPKPKSEVFPAEHRISAYGFISIHKDWLDAMGWTKPMETMLSLTDDGEGLIIRRKEGQAECSHHLSLAPF